MQCDPDSHSLLLMQFLPSLFQTCDQFLVQTSSVLGYPESNDQMFRIQCTQPSVSYYRGFINSRFIKHRLCIHSGEADYFLVYVPNGRIFGTNTTKVSHASHVI